MKLKRSMWLLGGLAVLCSACVKADFSISVNDDGSGTFTAVTAFNEDLMKQFGGLAALDPDAKVKSTGDFCKDFMADTQSDPDLKGAKVEAYREGGFCGAKITTTFKNVSEAEALFSGASGGTGDGLSDVVLAKAGAGYRFSADWTASSEADDATTSKEQEEFAKQFLKGFAFVIRVKLPGGQVQQDADAIADDGAMIWNLDPLKDRKLSAQTDLSKPVITGKVQSERGKNIPGLSGGSSSGDDSKSSKTWLYVVGLLVVVAAIGGFFLVKRNKAKTPAMAGVGTAGAAMPGSPPSATAPGYETTASFPGASPAAPAAPSASPAPSAVSAPVTQAGPSPAADAPQWDAARNAYIQYDRVNSRWMQYDQAAQTWRPID